MIEIRNFKYYMDGYLQSNLDDIKNTAIPNKWDSLLILFGREGSGKSTLGTQIGIYLDNNFNNDDIVFKPTDFITTINEAMPESAILWDEAITGADVAKFADKISNMIISQLTQIRKKKLMIIICFPYLWKLNRYFVFSIVESAWGKSSCILMTSHVPR